MPNYKIADIIFNAEHHFPYVKNLCANYEYFGKEKPEITLNVSVSDIKKEKSLYAEDKFTDDYCESLALYRKFLEYAINKETIILHSSALAVDDDAFLFTAPSGTGKSTHARLYRQAFLDRVTMINDDKPVIKKVGEDFYVFGTPWNGKHQLDTNSKFKIKAVCNLKRGEENKIYPISSSQMLFVLLNQTLRPKDERQADALFSLLDQLLKKVGLYQLECNTNVEAAKLSYSVMKEGIKNEN